MSLEQIIECQDSQQREQMIAGMSSEVADFLRGAFAQCAEIAAAHDEETAMQKLLVLLDRAERHEARSYVEEHITIYGPLAILQAECDMDQDAFKAKYKVQNFKEVIKRRCPDTSKPAFCCRCNHSSSSMRTD